MKPLLPIATCCALLSCLCACGKKDRPTDSFSSAAPIEQQLVQLTEAVQGYRAMHGACPTNLEQLAAERHMKSVPAPPPGKHFLIDPKTGVVTLTEH